MKKMMTLFFAGCILAGMGLGLTVVELKDWKSVPFRTDLAEKPLQTHTEKLYIDLQEYSSIEINLNGNYHNHPHPETEIIYDAQYTGEIGFTIEYRGGRPGVYNGGWWNTENGNKALRCWIDTVATDDISEMFRLIGMMFNNKTYYKSAVATYIEKVTVYTAWPDKIIFM